MDAVSKMSSVERTETALRLAEKYLGVEPLLNPKGNHVLNTEQEIVLHHKAFNHRKLFCCHYP